MKFRADSVSTRDQDGVRQTECAKIEESAKIANGAHDPRSVGRTNDLFYFLDGFIARIDINARGGVRRTTRRNIEQSAHVELLTRLNSMGTGAG